MLRAYFVRDYDEATGIAVVAESAKEAKTLAYASGGLPFSEYIDLRVHWVRNAEVSGLEKGLIKNDTDALKRGMYSEIEGRCEECGINGRVRVIKGKVVCIDCYDRIAMSDNSAVNS